MAGGNVMACKRAHCSNAEVAISVTAFPSVTVWSNTADENAENRMMVAESGMAMVTRVDNEKADSSIESTVSGRVMVVIS
jgi:hypothetical protein